MTEFSQGPALWQAVAALLIFAAAYVCILIEKWDRMYTALGGACLMLILGIVPLEKALTNYANWPISNLSREPFYYFQPFSENGHYFLYRKSYRSKISHAGADAYH